MNISYKQEHEDFVSNHDGTTVLEICVVSSVAPLGCLLRNVLINWTAGTKQSIPKWAIFSIDFVTLVVSVFCAFTVLASHMDVFLTSMICAVICILMITEKLNKKGNPSRRKQYNQHNLLDKIVHGKRDFVTNWRANVNVATAICILAVDFGIFPRRFCKAETYGSGVMDVGVGSFVLSNAVVSPEARGKQDSSLGSIWRSIRATAPLWLLGLIRLFSVKSVDYQEHVTEYGVHWNFFFTLAAVRIGATIIYTLFPASFSWLLSLATMVLYQYMQDGPWQLKPWILHGSDGLGSRVGLLEANREGIFSCLGYLAIYLAGVQLGRFLLKPTKPRYFFRDWLKLLLKLICIEATCIAALYLCIEHLDPVSRRLANASYLALTLQFNVLMIIGFLLTELLTIAFKQTGILISKGADSDPEHSFSLLEAVNKNGLFYFLLANVLTGLVNLSIRTIHYSAPASFTVVFLYLLTLSVIVTVLKLKNITLKFW